MKALLWDMNGVIVDDESIQEHAWRETLLDAAVDLHPGWWTDHFLGRKVPATLPAFLPDRTPVQIAQLLEAKRRRYWAIASVGLPLVRGALEMFAAAAQAGLGQGLVTSATAEDVQLVLAQTGLAGRFDALVCGADVVGSKPSPDGFLLAAERLGVPPSDCWVLEDAPHGVAAAKTAGMRCVGLTTSRPAADLNQADLVVDRLGPALLRRLAASSGEEGL